LAALPVLTITFKYPSFCGNGMRRGGVLRQGQVAIEYVIIMGFALFLVAPLLIVYYDQANRLNEQTTAATVERATKQIVEAADTVYYLGEPSMRTITVDLPENVDSVTVQGRSVTLAVKSSHGTYEQTSWSAANLTGTFSNTEGIHVLVIQALPNDMVNITERT
jgi:hypothetical protein